MGKEQKFKDPETFGPHFWFVMHAASFGYPDMPTTTDMTNYKDFYYGLRNIIPCDECRVHYSKMVFDNPIDKHLHSRADLVRWVINLHNIVNARLGKPDMNVDDAIELYTKKPFNWWLLIVLVTVVSGGAWWWYRK